MPKIQDKMRSKLIWSLKFFVMLAGLAYLIWSIQNSQTEFGLLFERWKTQPQSFAWIVIILITGSTLNWFGEIKKWQSLVGYISFIEALKQSVVSHSLALFTPNKLGEYGGKCMFYSKTEAPKIIALTGLGHLSQLLMTLFFGSFGLFLIYGSFEMFEIIHLKWSWMIVMLLLVFGIIMGFKPIKKKLWAVWLHFKHIKTEKSKPALFWSCFRYLIFAHQFLFLLWYFDAHISYVVGLSLISSVYLLSSLIPVLAFGDALIKGSIAVVLMSYFSIPASTVMLTVFLMWLGNVVLPAGLGYIWLWAWQPQFSKLNK